MRDLRKVREQSQLRLTYSQFFALLGLMAVSLLLSGLVGYYFGRGATASERAAIQTHDAPLVPEDVETESVATLLALARERQRDKQGRLTLDYDDLLPVSDKGVPQALRQKKPKPPPPDAAPPEPRELEPAEAVSSDDPTEALSPPESPSAAARTGDEAAKESRETQAEAEGGRYTIQVSSFQRADQAESLVRDLKRKGFSAFAITADVNGKTWHRVRIGGFESKDDAMIEMQRLSVMRSDLRPMVTFQ